MIVLRPNKGLRGLEMVEQTKPNILPVVNAPDHLEFDFEKFGVGRKTQAVFADWFRHGKNDHHHRAPKLKCEVQPWKARQRWPNYFSLASSRASSSVGANTTQKPTGVVGYQ